MEEAPLTNIERYVLVGRKKHESKQVCGYKECSSVREQRTQMIYKLALCGLSVGQIARKLKMGVKRVKIAMESSSGAKIIEQLTDELNDGIRRKAIYMRHDATSRLQALLKNRDWRAVSYAIDRIHGFGAKSNTDERRVTDMVMGEALPGDPGESLPMPDKDRAILIEHLKSSNGAGLK